MKPVAKKTFYGIGEVSDITGLEPHVLRYWEDEFDIISPAKNRGGSRVYRRDDIEKILLVKHLLREKRFTIEGARQELKRMHSDGEAGKARKLNAEPAVLAAIEDGLATVRELLTLD